MAGLGYCIKCKQKVELKEGKIVYYKNGAPAEKGICPLCNGKVSRILTREERANLKQQALGPAPIGESNQ